MNIPITISVMLWIGALYVAPVFAVASAIACIVVVAIGLRQMQIAERSEER